MLQAARQADGSIPLVLAYLTQKHTISDCLNVPVYMRNFSPQSAYLVPSTPARSLRSWVKQSFELYHSLTRDQPHLWPRIFLALIIWTAIVGTIQNINQGLQVADIAPQSANSSVASATTTRSNPVAATAGITPAKAATLLPTGPTGQLLPPGTMAPDFTYPNRYAHGQCTWYVAGRRQIPTNWGNANRWYFNASSSGWSVGTTPAIAAVAWTNAGTYGHVALVEDVSADGRSVYISEMNYRSVGVKTKRWVASSEFKYIY